MTHFGRQREPKYVYTYVTQTVQRLKSKMVYTCISFGVSYVFHVGLEGTGKNAVCKTWSEVGAPKFTTNAAKRTERTQMGQFLGYLLVRC